MSELVQSLLDNESLFGRIMTRCGIVIAANLLFVLFSLPVVTAGAAWVALCHVMLKTLRGDGVINPFKQFWLGFRNNFKQATLYWAALLALLAFGSVDVYLCNQFGGFFLWVKYAIFALGIAALILTIYLFPTMAAFADTLPGLLRNALYFAVKRPLKLLVLLFFHVFPMVLTYSDPQTLPLYAFLWTTCGFGLVALLVATLLLPEFVPYLPEVDACGDFLVRSEDAAGSGAEEKSEAEVLEEMRKLGM